MDVWDGFVDEGGRYAQQGPDFEGQTRRLRSGDGVHFTQAGARKLAHYVEREIRRVLSTRADADRCSGGTHARRGAATRRGETRLGGSATACRPGVAVSDACPSE